MTAVPWNDLQPNIKNDWLTEGLEVDFEDFLPIGSKETKTQQALEVKSIFKNYGRGVLTCRDDWDYDFSKDSLRNKMTRFIEGYNAEVDRWKQHMDKQIPIDDFVNNDSKRYKWSESLKQNLKRGIRVELDDKAIMPALYRPFCKQWLYFNRTLIERVYQMPSILPTTNAIEENLMLCVPGLGSRTLFATLATDNIPSIDLAFEKTQCFPLYTYALDGKIRRDNITDWALAQFQEKYGPAVTKRDIFHYVYALLHHPDYRERYKENLKRELPRILLVGGEEAPPPQSWGAGKETGEAAVDVRSSPLAPPKVNSGRGGGASSASIFQAFAQIGAKLAALHVGYEEADEYPLRQVVNKDVPFSWRVTKMKLMEEKTAVKVNESLTLAGIPPEALDYRLGNRSALEWVIDQYKVDTDKRSGIVSDPNRADQPDYIARLVGRVVTVSVETVKLVAALPPLETPIVEIAKESEGALEE